MGLLITTSPRTPMTPRAQKPLCATNRTTGYHGHHTSKKGGMPALKWTITYSLHPTSPGKNQNNFPTLRKSSHCGKTPKSIPRRLSRTCGIRSYILSTSYHPSIPILHLGNNQTEAMCQLAQNFNTAVPQPHKTHPAQLPRVEQTPATLQRVKSKITWPDPPPNTHHRAGSYNTI